MGSMALSTNETRRTEDARPRRAAAAFKALASKQRREILRLLGELTPQKDKACCGPSELCACKLGEALGLAPSTISHHMAVLEAAGLVHGRKDGTWVYYSLDRGALKAVAEHIQHL